MANEEPGSISGHNRDIYHLLRGAFGQCISISKIVDFDVFDVVPIRNVHIAIDVAGTGACIGIWRSRLGDWAGSLKKSYKHMFVSNSRK